jgi:nitrate/TMAO reductase-like tetraheme cytochrome c subunit
MGESMSDPNSREPRKSLIRRVLHVLLSPSGHFSLATLLIAGGVGGIIFWGGFNWAMELANTETFCISCHEMRGNVYKELQSTIHYKNRSGVRATCSDCHVPKEWFFKVRRKIQASNELLHKVLGTIDTPEKFEKHRLELAKRVWATMKETDSRECHNCHSTASMDPHKQSTAAQIMFDPATKGLICIDCHRGIAHKLPAEPEESEDSGEKK